MSHTTVSQARLMRSPWRFNQLALSVALVMGGVVALPGTAFAAAPDAGQVIGNTASATYSDGSGISRSATSNNVNTSVLQVASFTLTADTTKYVTLGGQVVYPHTLTNTGNGTDTFQLSVANQAGTDFNLGTLRIYADADNNGVADDAVDLNGQTVSLARDGVFTFVVVGSAPSTGVADGDSAVIDVKADSQVYEATPAEDPADVTNVDTAILTADAVINVVKSANVSQGLTGTLITYTLAYTNSGNNTATGVSLTDLIPTGTTYVADSGKWNGAAQTDGTGDDVFSITGSTITAAIGSVGQNVSGEIKFTVQVDATTAPGFLTNTAQYTYDPDGGGVKPAIGPTDSNDVLFEVLQTRNVGANDSTSNSDDGTPAGDDTVTQGPVAQGATVWFANKIWNQGNGTDSFDITLSGSNFPAGTIFTLYKDDQSNVLLDTTGNVTPDTGPLAAGGSYTVYVKAVLPATVSGNNGGAGYDVVVTATSTATGSVVAAGDEDDTVTDHLTDITANTVDLQNDGGKSTGNALDNLGAAWTDITTNPNNDVTFVLKVLNTSAVPDTFRLLADDDGTFGVSNDLPTNWTVTYHPDGGTGDCSTVAATSVVDTGLIVGGGSAVFCAVVHVPTGQYAPPGTTNIFFRASSDTYGTQDVKKDSVTVNTVRNISLVSSQSNTVYPGGSVDYLHTITNNGNVLEGNGVVSSVALATSGNLAGWSSVIYWDQDNNGSVTGDPVVTDLSFVSNAAAGLAPGESINLIVKVQSPGSALDATSNVTNVTVTTTNVSYSTTVPTTAPNADTTTVNAGQIRLYKTQALDAACDGTADGAFANTALSAKPGACIIYKIEAKNEGSQPATSVVLSDATPAFTSLEVVGGRPSVTQGSITTPAVPASGYTGNVSADFGTINGGQSATMEMSVQIDN